MRPFEPLQKALRTLATGWRQRLALWPQHLKREAEAKRPFLWFHAASVGEVLLTLNLVKELRPSVEDSILMTTMTPQGLRMATEGADLALFAPLDIGWVVRRFLDRLRPEMLLVAETELWPNLVGHAHREGIPTVLFNGRISPRAFGRFMAFRPLFRKVLRSFDLVLARSPEDGQRLLRLGAPRERLRVVGDLKLYQGRGPLLSIEEREHLREELALPRGCQLLVAGSTHPGEEEALLRAFEALRRDFPGLLLLLAPRHVERSAEGEALARSFGFRTARRSCIAGGWEVLVVDTIGELRRLYGLADVAFVGGSLVEGVGGHNVLEVIAHGKVALFGPHTENLASIARRVLEVGAGIEVRNSRELEETCRRLLSDPSEGSERGSRGLELLKEGEGAMRRTVEAIRELLERRSR